jgi:D-beta-D-heptose 7-phosphate kinase/D-beta-D-heptose 1-phosphate adenosyltransferase
VIAPRRAAELCERFGERRLLVLGDLFLDRYVWGSVERISPEAPVPVVRVDRESSMLGGAGNVARNALSLGARVEMVAAVGRDEAALRLRELFAKHELDPGGLVTVLDRPSTTKTRVIARGQHLVRYDLESDEPLAADALDQILEEVRARMGRVDGVIVEDYAKGVLTREVAQETVRIAAAAGRAVFVDPKLGPWDMYRGAELIKPNLREAQEVCGLRVRREHDLPRLGRAVLEHSGAQNVAITRGEHGIDWFAASGESGHFAARPRPVADNAGAGDTVISVMALARLSGASWPEAAELANCAAGFVVGLPGTATVTPEELRRMVEQRG